MASSGQSRQVFCTSRTSHPQCDRVVCAIDEMMRAFDHSIKNLGYGKRWIFANGMWIDLIDYKNKGLLILRANRGAWLVRQYPMLSGWFDEVGKVIGKLVIHDVEMLHTKSVAGVLQLLHDAPPGVGVRG